VVERARRRLGRRGRRRRRRRGGAGVGGAGVGGAGPAAMGAPARSTSHDGPAADTAVPENSLYTKTSPRCRAVGMPLTAPV
jgi:hypothetical protein